MNFKKGVIIILQNVKTGTKLEDHMTGQKEIPFIRLLKIMSEDVRKISGGEYELDDIMYKISKAEKGKKNIARALKNELYGEVILLPEKSKGKSPARFYKTVCYICDRLVDFTKSENFIYRTGFESPSDMWNFLLNVPDDAPYPEDFLSDENSYVLCFQLEKDYSGIVVELGNQNIVYEKDGETYPAKRLSITSVKEDGMVLLAEYEIVNGNIYTASHSGSLLCDKNCETKETEEYFVPGNINERFNTEELCKCEKLFGRQHCMMKQIDVRGIIKLIARLKYLKDNREVRIGNPNSRDLCEILENKNDSAGELKLNHGDYSIIPITANYVYADSLEEGEVKSHHKSPVSHYRKGCEKIVNKFGTEYSRKGSVVNAGNETIRIYKY